MSSLVQSDHATVAPTPLLDWSTGHTTSCRHAPRRSPHHQMADPDGDDVRRAWATVPSGSDGRHGGEGPDIDIHVWVRHVQFQRTAAPDVLAALVEEYSTLATSLAHRLVRHGDPLEDIQQVALEALVSSLHRFDVERSLPFPAFARPTISGAIKRHYRDRGWSIRTPRSVHDIASPLRDAEERLTAELGRAPRRVEVAEALGVPEATVRRVDQAFHCRAAISLDQPGPDGGAPQLEALGASDPRMVTADERLDLRDAIGNLTERERTLLNLYYVDEMSQRKIGEHYGISQMQVSRWLSRCVGRLRGRVASGAA